MIPTRVQGSMSLWYKNFLFVSHFKKNGIGHWRCENYLKNNCGARVIVVENDRVYGVNEKHNHQIYENLDDLHKRHASVVDNYRAKLQKHQK